MRDEGGDLAHQAEQRSIAQGLDQSTDCRIVLRADRRTAIMRCGAARRRWLADQSSSPYSLS
jgi:hypothetical protein